MGRLSKLLPSDEHRLYAYSRVAFNVVLVLMLFTVAKEPGAPAYFEQVLALLTTLGTAHILVSWKKNPGRAVMHVLVSDLLVVAGMTYGYHGVDDAFFPAVVMLVVTYALVLSGHRASIAVLATTGAYALGHAYAYGFAPPDPLGFLLRAASLPIVGLLVATTVEGRRQREAETVAAVAESAQLYLQLGQRLSELQAVSDITEAIHSSLDFDTIGPRVLEILAKVIGVDSCCLFVLGRDMSETIFSASYGMEDMPSRNFKADPSMLEEHFTCTTVFEHPDAMVLFCGAADDIEALADSDRLVLNAVSSELVVAVENSRLYKLTKMLAVTDELTRLNNYRYFQQRLDEETQRALRYDKKLSLLMIDVDDFKAFNDANGHLAGDQALTDLGAVLKEAVRGVDILARYGGEEFAVVLPETDAAGAFMAAEKIREAVATHRFTDETGASSYRLTLSIGLATLPTHALDKESLLREADNAVYQAKTGGKNRVRAPQRDRRAEQGTVTAIAAQAAVDEWTGN